MIGALFNILSCPLCRAALELQNAEERNGHIISGMLIRRGCGAGYPINNGIPILVTECDRPASQSSWLGPIRGGKIWPRAQWLLSNLAGLVFLPLLAAAGWCCDLYLAIRRLSGGLSIRDVRGLLFWHLRHLRPYHHLRMAEHALVMTMIRGLGADAKESWIIDLGAKKSCFASYLARQGYKVCAVDLDLDQVYWQKKMFGNLNMKQGAFQCVVGSATALPFLDNSAHLTSISVIEHICTDTSAFSEIGRVIGEKHHALVTLLYQDQPLWPGQRNAAWRRAREHHPAYGVPRSVEKFILTPSGCEIISEHFFWKRYCRLTKKIVRLTKILEQSMLFDYFIFLRLIRLEQALFPGRQGNRFLGQAHPWQWAFKLRKPPL